ncbi:MAG: aldolase/citrate lyase family protein [Candidatus Latescibacterota bacterium]
MHENIFKKKLLAGENVIGTFLNIPSPVIVEIMQRAGFDFFVVDGEHGIFNPESMDICVRTGDLVGFSPVIRVSHNSPIVIQKAMDLLPAAVLIPQVTTFEEAERAVRSALFPPRGIRGNSPNTRYGCYSADSGPNLTRTADENACIICQIEGVEGVRNLDAILSVKEIDGIFIGPYDLSTSMGIPGQVEDPRVIDKMEDIVARSKANNKFLGTYCQDPEQAKRWRKAGLQFLAVGVDTSVLYTAFSEMAKRLR